MEEREENIVEQGIRLLFPIVLGRTKNCVCVDVSPIGSVVCYSISHLDKERVEGILQRFRIARWWDKKGRLFIFFKKGGIKKEAGFHNKFCAEFLGLEWFKSNWGEMYLNLEEWKGSNEEIKKMRTEKEFCKATMYCWELTQIPNCIRRIAIDGTYNTLEKKDKIDVYNNYIMSLQKNGWENRLFFHEDEEIEAIFERRKVEEYICTGVCKQNCDPMCKYKNKRLETIEKLPIVCMQGNFKVLCATRENGDLKLELKDNKTNTTKNLYLWKGELLQTQSCIREFEQIGIHISPNLPDKCWDDFLAYINSNAWNTMGKKEGF